MKSAEQKAKKVPAIRFASFDDAWVEKKIFDVAEIVGGGTPSTANPQFWDGNIDWYAPAEINDQVFVNGSERKITKLGLENSSAKVLPANRTVLFTSRAGIGKTAILQSPAATNQGFQSLVLNDDTDTYFVYSMTDKIKAKAERIASGSTFAEISGKMLGNLELVFPSKKEQSKIGSFFSNIDSLISLEQKKYDKLTQVKKSMLEKMFPKEGMTVPEIRFAGFTGDWKEKKLSEIAVMHARIGWQNLRTSEFLDSGEYMLITGTDFQDGVINFKTCHYVEKERYDQDKHIQIKNGSILITKDGTLGKVAFVDGLKKPATLNAGVFNVENQDDVDGRYLFQYLKAPFLMDYVSLKATGGTIKHLNQNILVDFPVKLPSKSEQQKIGSYFSHLDSLISLQQRKLEKLKNIKKSLLEKMFV